MNFLEWPFWPQELVVSVCWKRHYLRVYLLYGCMFVLVVVSPPQTGQYSRWRLVCPSYFAPCLRGEWGREQLVLEYFSCIYKYKSKYRMSQPSTVLATAACLAVHLLRIILFAFIKLFPSLELSHPPRREGPAAVRLSVVFLWLVCVGTSQTRIIF